LASIFSLAASLTAYLYVQCPGQLTVAQDLYAIAQFGNGSAVQKNLRCHLRPVLKTIQDIYIDGDDLFGVPAGKASLGKTSVQRHLATLKTGFLVTGTGQLTFVSLTCCLAVS
jgi:hypothetical protein